ncbi:MAG: LysE family transporter [Tissierellia bacterium]|nr:LysE family transporter [Tissierellia bacterium]
MFNLADYMMTMVVPTITPGPNNIMSMSNASKLGIRKSLPFNFGVFVGSFIVSVLIAIFSKFLYGYIPSIAKAMKVFGFVYMLYLAYKTYFRSSSLDNSDTNSKFLSGVLLQFVNPKSILFGFTLITTKVTPFVSDPIFIVFLMVLRAGMSLFATLCWTVFGSLFRVLFTTHAKIVNGIMAILLIYCGFMMLLA